MTPMADQQNQSFEGFTMSEPERLGDILPYVMRDIDKRIQNARRQNEKLRKPYPKCPTGETVSHVASSDELPVRIRA